mgnify:CR=1 FL=1
MDYDALVKQFGKDQADLIVSQMNSDPRLQRFTPQRLNLMQDDAIGFENSSNLFDDAQRQVEGENYFRAATDYALGATEGALAAIGSVGGPIGEGIGRVTIYDNLKERGLNLWDALSRSADEYFSSKPSFSPSQPFDMRYYVDGNYLPPLQDSVQRDVGNAVAKGVLDTVTDPVGYLQDLYYGITDPAVSVYENTSASLPYYGNAALQKLQGDDNTEAMNIADKYLANAITSLGLVGLGISEVFPSGKGTKSVTGLLDDAAEAAKKAKAAKKAAKEAEMRRVSGITDLRYLKSGAGAAAKGEKALKGVGAGDPRAGDMQRIADLDFNLGNNRLPEIPTVRLDQFEGRPFMTSMSDRIAAGDEVTGVNNVIYDIPVSRRGGQNWMFDNPDQVWASDLSVVTGGDTKMHEIAGMLKGKTGQDPLFVPWTMSPTGGDYSQTGQLMLTHARNAMEPSTIKELNKEIREFFPEFKGVENPESMYQIYTDMSGQQRFKMMGIMDKKYRNRGSLTTGEARLTMLEQSQLNTPDGRLRNVGIVDAGAPIADKSGHPVYNTGLIGHGEGHLDRPISAWELMPDHPKAQGVVDLGRPTSEEIRPLAMKPYFGMIDDNLLKKLGY